MTKGKTKRHLNINFCWDSLRFKNVDLANLMRCPASSILENSWVRTMPPIVKQCAHWNNNISHFDKYGESLQGWNFRSAFGNASLNANQKSLRKSFFLLTLYSYFPQQFICWPQNIFFYRKKYLIHTS